MTRAE